MSKEDRDASATHTNKLRLSVLGNLHALGFTDVKISDVLFRHFAIASRALGDWAGDADLDHYQDRNVAIFKVRLPSIPGLSLTCEMNSRSGAPTPYNTYYTKRSLFTTKLYPVAGPTSLLKINFTKRDYRKFGKLLTASQSRA